MHSAADATCCCTAVSIQENQLLLLLSTCATHLLLQNTPGAPLAAVLLLHADGFCSRPSTSCISLGLQGVNALLVPVRLLNELLIRPALLFKVVT
jgi:hypothetical protein